MDKYKQRNHFKDLNHEGKNENKIKQIMANNLLSLRKKNKKIDSKIKDNNIYLYSPIEEDYIISNISFQIPKTLNEYYNNLKNKNLFLYQSINNLEEIISKFSIDKNNLIKFILLQINYYIEYIVNNTQSNIGNMNNFFDNNTIDHLINILYEYTYMENNNKIIEKTYNKINDNGIIIYNIAKILLNLTSLSNDYSVNILTNDNNINFLFLSMKYYYKKNQLICNYLLLLLNNCFIDSENEILHNHQNLITFLFEILSNYKQNPIENIIQSDLLFTIINFLSESLNENTFDIYMNNPYASNCILLMVNIILNYDNEFIKFSSIKCLAHLLHCIDENNILNVDNFQNLKISLLPYLNVERYDNSIVIKVLEIFSLFTYLYEIDSFVDNSLIDEINQLLINYIIHKEQNKILFYNNNELNQKFNIIIENISIILLNSCLSKKIFDFIIYHTTIVKNIIIIIYNYSIDINILKNLYNFLNEFMDNEDNFMALILANFLEMGIIQTLDRYLDMKVYEIIFIVLNLTVKCLEYGNIYKDKNIENKKYSKINFVQSFLDKKGFNDVLNLISSPDFGDNKCSELAKKIQEIFFSS